MGGCYSFDGIDDYVSVLDSPGLDTTINAFTLTAWVRDADPDDGSDDDRNILTKGDVGGTASNTFRFRIDGDKRLQLNIGGGPGLLTSATGSTILQENTWYHVVGVFDASKIGSEIIIYVNGKQDANPTPKNFTEPLINAGNLAIGRQSAADCNSPYNSCWKGEIDEVQIYNQALTLSQIRELHAQGLFKHVLVVHR